eukprot:TRINITY_DN33352_c0_g1_i1.p1 TRINITY_DN33352_c0_g1~~TRINITY_DN33352_c0_g1_i1.p1  ORF type:complete len:866 (+),score=116.59 TRINITY_DN33352_c0_g1_i1:133-2730(+)
MLGVLPGQPDGIERHSTISGGIGELLLSFEDEELLDLLRKIYDSKPALYSSVLHVATELPQKITETVENDAPDKIANEASLGDPKPLEFILPVEPAVEEKCSPRSPKTVRFTGPCRETIVQFSCFMYFVEEQEGSLTVDVMRIGDVSRRSEVRYKTRDATAKAGVRYVATEGKLIFEPGDVEQFIKLEILDNAAWDTTLEFAVELLQEDLSGATLGRYLYQTRVKVIDNSCFPTDKYSKDIGDGQQSKIPKWGLILEYFKMNYENPTVRFGMRKMMLVDLCHNVFFFLKLFMNVYLIDFVLVLTPGQQLIVEDREVNLVIIVAASIVPFAALHYLDYKALTWKVGGASRNTLQKSLLRKFLNYTEASRESLNASDLTMAMTRDAVDIVQDGFMNILKMWRAAGQLLCIFIFQVSSPVILDKPPRPLIFVPLFVFPFVLLVFLLLRRARTNEFEFLRNRKQDECVDRVHKTVTNYRLISDYNQRPMFVSWFETKIKEYNAAVVAASQVLKNNEYFSPWFTLAFACAYTYIGAKQIIAGDSALSLGIFVTNLSIINAIGEAYGGMYKTLLTIQSTFDSLERIVHFLNLPTDLLQRKSMNRHRRSTTHDMRARLRGEIAASDSDQIALDLLPICVDNLKFKYSTDANASLGLAYGKMEIAQGHMVSLIGRRGGGKSTLLKLLGGVMLPTSGELYVPSHLRVLHVSSEAMFIRAPMLQNLTFGVPEGDSDASPDRVKKICSRLGLNDWVQAFIDTDDVLPWMDVLSETQSHLICLARALIANPEVLCVHKPTLAFPDNTSALVMQVFKDFVEQKGLEQDPATFHMRRPRTCIMTNVKLAGVSLSDRIFLVDEQGIQPVLLEDISADMLG